MPLPSAPSTTSAKRKRIAAAAAAVVAVAFGGGCGGDDGQSALTSASDSARASLPAGASELVSGTLELRLRKGSPVEVDTVQATRDAGVDPPACAGLAFGFAWQAAGPGADGVSVTSVVQGVESLVGSGSGGEATVGCAVLGFSANADVVLQLSFVVGSLS